tara:strand:- start:315 stop:1043 length:729 start_codon:yes stop_codon:yes gene_type:complete
MEEGYKQCYTCKEFKIASSDFFGRRKESKDNLKSSCKSCLNARNRKYKDENPEKAKQIAKKSRWLNKEKINSQNATWRSENKGYGKKYYAKNSNKLKLRQKSYRKKLPEEKLKQLKEKSNARALEWRRKNPEYSKLYARKYREANKEKFRAIRWNYKARKKLAVGTHTGDDIIDIVKQQNNLCFWCKTELKSMHIDHCLPLSKGGSNYKTNLVASCPSCNMSKRDKMPEDFIKWMEVNHTKK